MQLDIGQQIIIIRDKRDPIDIIEMRYGCRVDLRQKIGRYEGYFPWAVMYNNGKEWLPGIWSWEDYVSGEAVTQEDVPMNTLYPTILEEGKYFALPVYRHRFIAGRTKLWEHEIDYQVIKPS